MDFLISLGKDLLEGCEAQRHGSFSGGLCFGHKARLMVKEAEDAIPRGEGMVLKNFGASGSVFYKKLGTWICFQQFDGIR